MLKEIAKMQDISLVNHPAKSTESEIHKIHHIPTEFKQVKFGTKLQEETKSGKLLNLS